MTIARGLTLLALAAVLAGGCGKKSGDPHGHHHQDSAPQHGGDSPSMSDVVIVEETAVAVDAPATGVELLAEWMCGKFSSEWQYEENPQVYFNLRSYVTRIWPNRADGPWLYAETGVHIEHMNADAPFSQRIYQLVPGDDGEIAIRHYEFIEDDDEVRLEMLGAWRFENPLADVTLDQLKERDTCAVYVKRTGDSIFEGRTRDKECIPNNEYVDYAVFERWYMPNEMRAWDRGFSEGDIHLVGPVDGPYIFEKTDSSLIHFDAASDDALDSKMIRELPPATTPVDD